MSFKICRSLLEYIDLKPSSKHQCGLALYPTNLQCLNVRARDLKSSGKR